MAKDKSATDAAAADAGIDPNEITRRVDAVLNEPLYWFPVRHHSPTTARHLRTAINARKPKIVFIEGPYEANDLIPHVTDKDTAPPVAIYSSYRDDNNVLNLNGVASAAPDIPARFAVWYPLTPYSPEYIAMKTAASLKAEVVFIDLPHHALIQPHQEEAPQVAQPPETPPQRGRPNTGPNDDQLITGSSFYRRLAEAAGFKSWDEAWDTLFENPNTTDHEAFRREMATFCCAARVTADDSPRRAEETAQRERHFMQVIRETLAARKLKPQDAMVVCGGFHLFLDRNDTQPPPACPEGTLYTTIVPYSYFRISEMSGYGAGNRAPQFYQSFFDLVESGRTSDIAMEHAIAVLRQMRKGGDPLSTADAISVTHHAGMLARLRGRHHTTLDDIHDALITCCCKGNPSEEGQKLQGAMDAAGIGNAIGKVTGKLGRLPIVNDFHSQISDLQLGEVTGREKKMSLKLDKREPLDSRRSAFLHRVSYLKVPFGALSDVGGDFSGTLFREYWQLKWDPRTEPALIEQNLYGDTVEAAALARLQEALAQAGTSAGETCKRLLEAIDLDLPDLVAAAEVACGTAIDTDGSFVSQATALQALGRLEQYAAFRGLRRDRLEELLARCYDRACFALPDAAAVPEEQQAGVVGALLGVAEVVQRDSVRYDRNLFATAARTAADSTPAPFLRGAFLGLLCEIRELPACALAAEVAGLAQASTEVMVTAGDLLDGMLAVSRTSLMLGADALVAAVDDLLKAADWDPFLVMLPRLRGAVERLTQAQKDSLAASVARRYGLTKGEEVRAMSGSLAATALVARLDAATAAVLKNWPL